MISDYQKYEPIFGEWHIVKKIGEGAYGKVFEINRTDFGITYKSALKIISIPQNDSEIDSIKSEGMDDVSVREYFNDVVGDFVREFSLMSKMKGSSYIVSYENHKVVQHEDGIGWDILIQMELLTPLVKYLGTKTMEEKDFIKIGIDLCRGLELCHKNNIIHRDIKPDNIFISDNGDFKLGDFGIARTAEKTMSGLSRKGTIGYMAPEVFNGIEYGPSVDIYSLGLVLYMLCNNNRLPFYPPFPEKITYSAKEEAAHRRIRGELLSVPQNCSEELAAIILKATKYTPSERYHSASEMLRDLERLYASLEQPSQSELGETVLSVLQSVPEKESSQAEVVLSAEKEIISEETEILIASEEENGGEKTEFLSDENIDDKTEIITDAEAEDEKIDIVINEAIDDEKTYIVIGGADFEKTDIILDETVVGDDENTEVLYEKEDVNESQKQGSKGKKKSIKKFFAVGISAILLGVLFCGYYFFSPKTVSWCCYHKFDEATCTKEICYRCGKTKEGNGHDYTEATCTMPQKCKTCGATKGATLGHNYTKATCTTPKKCKTCGATRGDALGHDLENYICNRCKEQVITQNDIPYILEIDSLLYDKLKNGSVNIYMIFTNKSSKTINNISFEILFYDASDKVIMDDVTHQTSTVLSFDEAVRSGKTIPKNTWISCFHNYTFGGILSFKEIEIEYSDGTKLILSDDIADYAVVAWR